MCASNSKSISERKCIFQWSEDLYFKNCPLGALITQQAIKKLNVWEKTAVEKSSLIKAWYMKFKLEPFNLKFLHRLNTCKLFIELGY